MSDTWLSVAERFGIWAAFSLGLVFAVLVFAWKREIRMANRIDTLEREASMASLASAKALETNGIFLKQIADVQAKQLECQQQTLVELRCRPCIARKEN